MRLLEPAVVFSGANQVSIKIAVPKSIKFRVFFIIITKRWRRKPRGITGWFKCTSPLIRVEMRKILTKLKRRWCGLKGMIQLRLLPSQRRELNAVDSRIKLCRPFAKHAKEMKHLWLHGFKDAVPSKIQLNLQVSETIQCSIELWVTSCWKMLEVPGSVWIFKHCKRSVRKWAKPSGCLVLWFILNKCSLDKDPGASLSQHHLL